MSIKLKGSSDGSVSLDAPSDTSPSGSDIALTLPTSAGSANQFLKNSGTAGTLEYSSMVEDSSGNLGLGGVTSPTWTSGGGIHLGDNYGIGFGDGGSGRPSYQIITTDGSQLDFRCGFGADTADITFSSTGNIGIGTTSPSSYAETRGIAIRGANRSGHPTYVGQDGSDTSGFINMYADSSNSFRRFLDIGTVGSNSAGTGKESNIRFITNASSGNAAERMRLTNTGMLAINTTVKYDTHDVALAVRGAFPQTPIEIQQTSTSTHFAITFRNLNGLVGSITTNGSATAYNQSSDYRLKENVVNLSGAITRVKQLAPKRFNFIVDSDTTVDGFLAHEAQTVVPEAVTGTHNGVEVWEEGEELPDGVSVGDNKLDEDGNTIPQYQGIDQSKLVPLLTAALQEAIAKIETLETKVAALEAA